MEKYILIYIYNYYICLKIDFFHFVLLFGFQMTCHNEPCFAVGRRFKYESSCEPLVFKRKTTHINPIKMKKIYIFIW